MKKIVLLLSILALVLIGCTQTQCDNTELEQIKAEYTQLEKFYNNYNKATINRLTGITERENAERNYQLWSLYYDDGYFTDAIPFCENAREYYSLSNKYHQTAIQYFENAKKLTNKDYTELIDAYIDFSSSSIDINWAMYEACEYFESAAYKYSQNKIESGHNELEKGNLKIAEHDGLIKQHNTYVARITVLEEEI